MEFWQHEFQHASQKCILRFRRNFLREQIFWTSVNMWSVIKIKRKSFGRIVKTAFYISSGQLWRKNHFWEKSSVSYCFHILSDTLLGLLQLKVAGLSNELTWPPVKNVGEKVVSLKHILSFHLFWTLSRKLTGKNVKPAFQLSSEAIWRNLKFLKDLWINIIFGLRVKNKRHICQKCILGVRWNVSSEKLLWTIHTFVIFFRI